MTLLFRIGFFCFLIKLSMISAAFGCGDFPPQGFDDPAKPRLTGRIYNPNYGYSVVIPNGLVGYTSAAPAPYHGFGIVLSWEPRSYLYVDGSYNSLDLKSLEDVEANYLASLKEESAKLISGRHSVTKLGDLQARRYIVLHTCPKVSGDFIDDYTVAFNQNKGIVYTVALLTTAERYEKDKLVLEELLKTWKLEPIK